MEGVSKKFAHKSKRGIISGFVDVGHPLLTQHRIMSMEKKAINIGESLGPSLTHNDRLRKGIYYVVITRLSGWKMMKPPKEELKP